MPLGWVCTWPWWAQPGGIYFPVFTCLHTRCNILPGKHHGWWLHRRRVERVTHPALFHLYGSWNRIWGHRGHTRVTSVTHNIKPEGLSVADFPLCFPSFHHTSSSKYFILTLPLTRLERRQRGEFRLLTFVCIHMFVQNLCFSIYMELFVFYFMRAMAYFCVSCIYWCNITNHWRTEGENWWNWK